MVFGVLLRIGFEGAVVRADVHSRRPVALRLEPGNKGAGLSGINPGRPALEGIFPFDALLGCQLNPRRGCSSSTRLTSPHSQLSRVLPYGPSAQGRCRMQVNNTRHWGWGGGARRPAEVPGVPEVAGGEGAGGGCITFQRVGGRGCCRGARRPIGSLGCRT